MNNISFNQCSFNILKITGWNNKYMYIVFSNECSYSLCQISQIKIGNFKDIMTTSPAGICIYSYNSFLMLVYDGYSLQNYLYIMYLFVLYNKPVILSDVCSLM